MRVLRLAWERVRNVKLTKWVSTFYALYLFDFSVENAHHFQHSYINALQDFALLFVHVQLNDNIPFDLFHEFAGFYSWTSVISNISFRFEH